MPRLKVFFNGESPLWIGFSWEPIDFCLLDGVLVILTFCRNGRPLEKSTLWLWYLLFFVVAGSLLCWSTFITYSRGLGV
jgi:hypothetical protein